MKQLQSQTTLLANRLLEVSDCQILDESLNSSSLYYNARTNELFYLHHTGPLLSTFRWGNNAHVRRTCFQKSNSALVSSVFLSEKSVFLCFCGASSVLQ